MGKAAKADAIPGVTPAPQAPFMARNPKNNVHNDAWMTDNYTQLSGPLGRSPDGLVDHDRARLRHAHLRPPGPNRRHLHRLRATAPPCTCSTRTTLEHAGLPAASVRAAARRHQPGDQHHRRRSTSTSTTRTAPSSPPPTGRSVVTPRPTTAGSPASSTVAAYDPTPCLPPDERMPSVLPDHQGRLWFIGRTHGTVGVLDPSTGKCGAIVLGEEIENSFAMAKDGAYIVTRHGAVQVPRRRRPRAPDAVWRATYRNDGEQKVGPVQRRVGNDADALVGQQAQHQRARCPEYVAITDNADPLDVVVYRAADKLEARPEARRVPGADLQARAPARTRTRSSRWDGA